MFTQKDLELLKSKKIELPVAEQQLNFFRNGFPFMNIVKAATVGDGVVRLSDSSLTRLIKLYEDAAKSRKVLKFVPASGAATRMFKNLYTFIEIYSGNNKNYGSFMSSNGLMSIYNFISRIKDFAFYSDLKNVLEKDGKDIDDLIKKMDYMSILEALLFEKWLNYGNLPKGLLKFHRYCNYSRTSIEEHLVEGANYAMDKQGNVYIHFTVSAEHKNGFMEHISQVIDMYKKQFSVHPVRNSNEALNLAAEQLGITSNGVNFDISYSEQKPSTDTLAVDMENNPFRDKEDRLVFRPGGHGALIENLDDMDADILFIKNIDNVVPDKMKDATYTYKKALAGLLIEYQKKIFGYLREMENPAKLTDGKISEILTFIEKEMFVIPVPGIMNGSRDAKLAYIMKKLNRPIRICGMVKNEGEPGGGPFWAKNPDGTVSLQIVESSQIDSNNSEQSSIAKNATHFNPVDLVCAVKDYKGKKFHLPEFIDPDTGFISKKSKDGRDLKALELPGLWNGAMSDWTTIFMEVPIQTFNPVKMVDDLLRPEHQG